jgi:predicted nucleotidyltransferase component of viral defense system
MEVNSKQEALLLRLMHLIAEKFKAQAVLKGGMCLRLLNSPRSTQDIDYVFVGFDSRKDIMKGLEEIVQKEKDITITSSQLNSRGVFVDIASNSITAQLEISVAPAPTLPPEQMTTSSLAQRYQMAAQIITVMSLKEAFANKIAAALERTVLRDLYDITIYQPLTTFDVGVLRKRLSKLVVNRQRPKNISFKDAAAILRKKTKDLTDDDLKKELTGLVPNEFFTGGSMIIKSSITKLCDQLENLKES